MSKSEVVRYLGVYPWSRPSFGQSRCDQSHGECSKAHEEDSRQYPIPYLGQWLESFSL